MQKQTIISVLCISLGLSALRLPPAKENTQPHYFHRLMDARPGPANVPTKFFTINYFFSNIPPALPETGVLTNDLEAETYSASFKPQFDIKNAQNNVTSMTNRKLFEPVSKAQLITQFYFNEQYQDGFRELIRINKPGAGIEYATVFGIDKQTGLPRALPRISTMSGNSVSLNGNPSGLQVTAIAHTHPDNVFPAPSAGDLYAFGNYARSHPDFLYYVLAANGANYVLAVTDALRLSTFLDAYPQQQQIAADSAGNAGLGAGYNPGSKLYLSMQTFAAGLLSKSIDPQNPSLAELDAAHEAVQVYILEHFNTGISLFKQGDDGSFYPMDNDNGQTKVKHL